MIYRMAILSTVLMAGVGFTIPAYAGNAASGQTQATPSEIKSYDPIPEGWSIKIGLPGTLSVGAEYCTQSGECQFVGHEIVHLISACQEVPDAEPCLKARIPVEVLASSPAGSVIVRLEGRNYAVSGLQWDNREPDGSFIGGPVSVIFQGVSVPVQLYKPPPAVTITPKNPITFKGSCTASSYYAEGPDDSSLPKPYPQFHCDSVVISLVNDHLLIQFMEGKSIGLGFSGTSGVNGLPEAIRKWDFNFMQKQASGGKPALIVDHVSLISGGVSEVNRDSYCELSYMKISCVMNFDDSPSRTYKQSAVLFNIE